MTSAKLILAAATLGLGLLSAVPPAQAGECSVYVTWKSGAARSGVKVTGSVNMGGMTKTIRTDRDGKAVVHWSGEHSLGKVFVDGTDRGSCKDGGTLRVSTK